MTDPDHLHTETKVMQVRPHCEMLSKQFLLATQKQGHPNRIDLNAPAPVRQMNETLQSKFGAEIKDLSYPNLSENDYKTNLKKIHTNTVKRVIRNNEPNKVLRTRPPEINKTEKALPRTTRSTLAQLRSGYSVYLNSFKARIDKTGTVVDKCPNCDSSHTTEHLFNCPNNPTSLTVRDLWKNPPAAARFLNLAADDDHG